MLFLYIAVVCWIIFCCRCSILKYYPFILFLLWMHGMELCCLI